MFIDWLFIASFLGLFPHTSMVWAMWVTITVWHSYEGNINKIFWQDETKSYNNVCIL